MEKNSLDTPEPDILFVIHAPCEIFLKYLSLFGFRIFRPAYLPVETEKNRISLHEWIKTACPENRILAYKKNTGKASCLFHIVERKSWQFTLPVYKKRLF